MSFGDYGRGGGGYGGGANRGYQVRDGDDAYLQCSQKVESNIFTITHNVKELEKFIRFIGSDRDIHGMRDQMTQLQEQTRKIIKDTGVALKKLGQFDGGSQREASQRRLQQDKLRKDFQSVLQKWQRSSQIAMDKERESVGRARAASNRNMGGSAYDGYDEKAALIEEDQRRQMQQTDQQIDYESTLIEEREQSIKEIESTMLEVNDIYKDLATLVHEQGDMLDSIDGNMSQVESRVEGGTQKLTEASRYQKKARSKMCCILLIVTICLAVLVIILVTSLDKKKN